MRLQLCAGKEKRNLIAISFGKATQVVSMKSVRLNIIGCYRSAGNKVVDEMVNRMRGSIPTLK